MARKDRKKRDRARQNASRKRAANRLERRARERAGKDVLVVPGAINGVKMSQVIEQFIEPYIDEEGTGVGLRALVSVGIIAWNLALLPPLEREAELLAAADRFSDHVQLDLIRFLRELIARKLQHFPEYRRMVMEFTLTDESDGGYYLQVVSSAHSV